MAIAAGQIQKIRSGFVLPGVPQGSLMSVESCRKNKAIVTGKLQISSKATVAQVVKAGHPRTQGPVVQIQHHLSLPVIVHLAKEHYLHCLI